MARGISLPIRARDAHRVLPTRARVDSVSNIEASKVARTAGDSAHTLKVKDKEHQQCRLLCLPSELRNDIYELAFSNNNLKANLFEPTPPTKSLLLSCRQIWLEAKGFQKAAHRAYWETTEFVIRHLEITKTTFVMPFTEEDLAHVRHIKLFTTTRRLFNAYKQPLWHTSDFPSDKPQVLTRCPGGPLWGEEFSQPCQPDPAEGSQIVIQGSTREGDLVCCAVSDRDDGASGADVMFFDAKLFPPDFWVEEPFASVTRKELARILGLMLLTKVRRVSPQAKN
ncbi:hypothetical protein LTR27_006680 [Elasticomyces elasticus]|nr:hypothetical protein LTR27_006680 [Elasticomyces elasticus]